MSQTDNNVIILVIHYVSQTDNCYRQTNVTDGQMSQTDRQIDVTDRQMSQTDRHMSQTDICHKQTDVTNRQTYVTDRQMSQTDKCHIYYILILSPILNIAETMHSIHLNVLFKTPIKCPIFKSLLEELNKDLNLWWLALFKYFSAIHSVLLSVNYWNLKR